MVEEEIIVESLYPLFHETLENIPPPPPEGMDPNSEEYAQMLIEDGSVQYY